MRCKESESIVAAAPAPRVWLCDAADPKFIGEYLLSEEDVFDGVASYVNRYQRSVFRNNGFWYIGDIGLWPIQTHFRCVGAEGCPRREDTPPIPGAWTVNKYVGKGSAPQLQLTPCVISDEL